MNFTEIFIVVFIALVLGSFSTALIHRVPRGISWGAVRSVCINCGAKLGFLSLVPVFSWCFLKGRCRYCHRKISFLYPAIELSFVSLSLIAYFALGFNFELFFIIFSLAFLFPLFVIDIKYMRLPNILVLLLFILGLIRLGLNIYYKEIYISSSFLSYYIFDYLGGAFIYTVFAWGIGALFTKILKREALGLGDVKFFGAAGIWIGLSNFSYFLIISGIIAVFFSLIWRFIAKSQVFPFGPALIMSLYIILLA